MLLSASPQNSASSTTPGPSEDVSDGLKLLHQSEAPLSKEKETVSTENNEHNTQEQELWDRIRTTEGAARAEVLDELSHIAYNRDNYIECLQLVDTSIEIYFEQGGLDLYLKELMHLYHGKVLLRKSQAR